MRPLDAARLHLAGQSMLQRLRHFGPVFLRPVPDHEARVDLSKQDYDRPGFRPSRTLGVANGVFYGSLIVFPPIVTAMLRIFGGPSGVILCFATCALALAILFVARPWEAARALDAPDGRPCGRLNSGAAAYSPTSARVTTQPISIRPGWSARIAKALPMPAHA